MRKGGYILQHSGFSPRNREVILKAKEMSDLLIELHEFQSPQWGSNSKDYTPQEVEIKYACFSPRNGEIILKKALKRNRRRKASFSPRNGEIILKFYEAGNARTKDTVGFSPRNGEIILKVRPERR